MRRATSRISADVKEMKGRRGKKEGVGRKELKGQEEDA